MSRETYVLSLYNDSDIDNKTISTMVHSALISIHGLDCTVKPMEDTMLDHLEQACDLAEYGDKEKNILTAAWNDIVDHQKETGEWYND